MYRVGKSYAIINELINENGITFSYNIKFINVHSQYSTNKVRLLCTTRWILMKDVIYIILTIYNIIINSLDEFSNVSTMEQISHYIL